MRRDGHLIGFPDDVQPTAERLRHGTVRAERRVYRAAHRVEELAIAGELGDDAAVLLPAAVWLAEMGEQARLRQDPRSAVSDDAQAARRLLARLHDALGVDAIGVLLDAAVFDLPVPRQRRALLRAALHSLVAWRALPGHKKNPADLV